MSGTIRHTDENGQALFEGYEPADYSYFVSKDGFEFAAGDFEIVDTDVTIEVHLVISSTEEMDSETICLFPNPTTGLINILLPQTGKIEILNPQGLVINDFRVNAGKTELDLSSLPKGFYYVKISCDDRQFNHKIILH